MNCRRASSNTPRQVRVTNTTPNQLLAERATAKVRYIHAEQFVSDVVRAVRHNAFESFKESYHSLDLLLIECRKLFQRLQTESP